MNNYEEEKRAFISRNMDKPVFSLNQINVVIDMCTAQPSENSKMVYSKDPAVHSIITYIKKEKDTEISALKEEINELINDCNDNGIAAMQAAKRIGDKDIEISALKEENDRLRKLLLPLKDNQHKWSLKEFECYLNEIYQALTDNTQCV